MLDRDLAYDILWEHGIEEHQYESLLEALEHTLKPERGWRVILESLAEVYPESIFPVQHTAADDGNGPQVLSLIRLLRAAEDKLEAIADLMGDEKWWGMGDHRTRREVLKVLEGR